jgi:hypothetical protein
MTSFLRGAGLALIVASCLARPAQSEPPLGCPPANPLDGPFALDETALFGPGTGPGWFASVEVDLLKPHLKTTLPFGPAFPDQPALHSGTLDWAGSPRLSVGYHLSDGMGDVLFGYRMVASSGSGAGRRDRLDLQAIDLDYACGALSCGQCSVNVGFGLRAATVFFDHSQADATAGLASASSSFAGVGPQAFLSCRRPFEGTPLSAYLGARAGGVIGQARQKFHLGATEADTGSQSTATAPLSFEAGLAYDAATSLGPVRLSLGYVWERWWNLANTDNSSGELTLQGIAFRAEFSF